MQDNISLCGELAVTIPLPGSARESMQLIKVIVPS